MQTLALFFLATTAVGGVAWVFLYPTLSGERKAEQRRTQVAQASPIARTARGGGRGGKTRREEVEEALKDLERRARNARRPPLAARIAQAGLSLTKQHFIIASVVLGVVVLVGALVVNAAPIVAIMLGFAAGAGLPQWVLSFLKKRREKKFLLGLPDAVDVIVRGIKAGLPLLDSLKIVSNESPEPVRSEFRVIVDTQAIGMPLGEACGKLYERMPLPESNFFGIVIDIQQKSGGNLSEALGNLSKVLRERKKMRDKIQAMSMEAKASAAIIGSLPVVVMTLVWLTSPNYIELLWTHPTGRLMMAGSACWMATGVFVMKKMINFDF